MIETEKLALALGLFVCLVICGCGGKDQTTKQESKRDKKAVIAVSGSDTMVNVAQMWAEEYRKVAPDVTVEVAGGGSGVGIRDLMQGVVQVANSSRDIEPAEKEQILKNGGKPANEITVGYDGIAIYVHKDNPLDAISMEELARIFGEGGDITLWSQLGVNMTAAGGADEITRVSRQNSSGTYQYFREHVLNKKDFKAGSCDMSGSKDVVELVARTKGAIGYSGMGYATKGVKMLKIKTADGAVSEPSVESIHKKLYPLSRPLYMCTIGAPEGAVARYIEWILSAEGQKTVEAAGYVPMPKS